MEPIKEPQAVICDVDETLTERVTWYALTDKLGGSAARHANLFMNYLRKKINYQEMKQGLFEMWTANGPVTKQQLEDIFQTIHLKGEAVDFINQLKSRGYEICLISGSIKMFIKSIAEKYGIKHHYGNSEFVFDEHGHWVDFKYTRDEGALKIKQFQDFLDKTGFEQHDCIAVGDGDNDIELFQEIPGIVVNASNEHLKEIAWRDAKYLPRVLQILDSIEAK